MQKSYALLIDTGRARRIRLENLQTTKKGCLFGNSCLRSWSFRAFSINECFWLHCIHCLLSPALSFVFTLRARAKTLTRKTRMGLRLRLWLLFLHHIFYSLPFLVTATTFITLFSTSSTGALLWNDWNCFQRENASRECEEREMKKNYVMSINQRQFKSISLLLCCSRCSAFAVNLKRRWKSPSIPQSTVIRRILSCVCWVLAWLWLYVF